MSSSQSPEKEIVYGLAKEYAEDPYCLKLIEFFGFHPNARFSRLSILRTLSASNERSYLERAISHLIDNGVVRAYSEHSELYYGLSDNEALKKSINVVINLDWKQWQEVLRTSRVQMQKRPDAGNTETKPDKGR